jgi:SAM-dependent methyltransferase
MFDINNQKEYWNNVAEIKTFTHPPDAGLLGKYFHSTNHFLDYGCGYGRIITTLNQLGFKNITGVDTSVELINRGKKTYPNAKLLAIENPQSMPFDDDSFDAIILFAVLTCIPSNDAQKDLISVLHSKLVKGGILYISDYYLQENRKEANTYEYFNNDPNNYGVFSLKEGATFRHHTKDWIKELFANFELQEEKEIDVKTMNGHVAKAFQLIVKK